jgi:hypothetical protein
MIVELENCALPIMDVDLQLVNLRERVTIHPKQIVPAVVVEIEKFASPADETHVQTMAASTVTS